jgi:hypothetical protein
MRVRIEPVGDRVAIELRDVTRLLDITGPELENVLQADLGEHPEERDETKDCTVYVNPDNIVAMMVWPDVASDDASG